MNSPSGIRKKQSQEVSLRLARHIKYYLWVTFYLFAGAGVFKPVSFLEESSGFGLFLTVTGYIVSSVILLEIILYGPDLWTAYKCHARGAAFFVLTVAAVLLGGGVGMAYWMARGASFDGFRGLVWEFLPMLLCLLILAGGVCRDLIRVLPSMLLMQSVAAAGYVLLVIWLYPTHESRELFGGPHYAAYGLASVTIIPFAMLDKYNILGRCLAIVSYLIFAAFNIVCQSRGGFLMTALAIPTFVVVSEFYLRRRAVRKGSNLFNMRTLLAIALVAAAVYTAISMTGFGREVTASWSLTMNRLYGGSNEQSIGLGFEDNTRSELNDSRGAEARDYLAHLDLAQALVGRGYGGTWYSEFWNADFGIVHFGPLHLILKGGIPLLIGFGGVCFIALYCGWKKRKVDSIYIGVSAFIVFRILEFIKHGPFLFNYETIVFWLVLGMAMRRGGLELVQNRARRATS